MRIHEILAFPHARGFRVTGGTYPIREELKAIDASWHPVEKVWYVPLSREADLRAITRVKIMTLVKRAAYCHTPEEKIFVTESEAEMGFKKGNFCSRCDSIGPSEVRVTKLSKE